MSSYDTYVSTIYVIFSKYQPHIFQPLNCSCRPSHLEMDGNLSKVKLCSTSVKQVRKNPADPGNFGSFGAKVSGKSPTNF